MTGSIIRLPEDRHGDVQALLPWYATGRLESGDQALVEAHLLHCAECQADLRLERRLALEVAEASLDVDQGWAAMRARLKPRRGPMRSSSPWSGVVDAGRSALARWRGRGQFGAPAAVQTGPVLGWVLAVQFALLVALVAAIWPHAKPPVAGYHALAAAGVAPRGDMIVTFRPDTPESALRGLLKATGARLVDGPTAADAYVLQAPPARRDATVQALRRRPEVVLAEPIDAGGGP